VVSIRKDKNFVTLSTLVTNEQGEALIQGEALVLPFES
jgi:hypothetical protein